MNRDDKAQFVEEMKERFAGSSLVILADFKGSTVDQMNALRRACEPVGVSFKVVKNTLCRRAIEGTEKEALGEHFRGNVGVLFGGEDPSAAAKLFRAQAKANNLLVARAGFFEGIVLDAKGVDAVADLPSREELLSKLLATVQEAPRQVLGVLQGPARDLLYLLNNRASALEEG